MERRIVLVRYKTFALQFMTDQRARNMSRISISAGTVSLDAVLHDTPTADALLAALPIEGRANIWGDEIYFDIGLDAAPEPDARAEVAVGELGYWPPGHAFCIFYGRTPASTGDEPMAASPVNILGEVIGDATLFRAVRNGESVRIERAE